MVDMNVVGRVSELQPITICVFSASIEIPSIEFTSISLANIKVTSILTQVTALNDVTVLYNRQSWWVRNGVLTPIAERLDF